MFYVSGFKSELIKAVRTLMRIENLFSESSCALRLEQMSYFFHFLRFCHKSSRTSFQLLSFPLKRVRFQEMNTLLLSAIFMVNNWF